MHTWEKTFKKAARALSDREVAILNAPAAPKPRWAVQNSTGLISSNDTAAALELFNSPKASAGVDVSPETAMRLSAVYACVRLIAGAVAILPLPVYQLDQNGDREVAKDHPLHWLLNEQPTPRFSAAAFWEYMLASMLLRGDGFAVIVRNRAGVPIEFIPIPAYMTVVQRVDDRLHYYIDDNGKYFGFDQDDILHFPGFGFNGWRSMSVVRYAAFQSIGTAIAMEEYAGEFFASGTAQKVVIESPMDLDDKQIARLRDLWEQKYGGSGNHHKPLVLYGGMKANPLQLSAQDSQLLESRRFQVEDIARAFAVPPFMIGAYDKTTSWGSGIEQMGLGFVLYTLMPHLTRIQQEINRKIFRVNRYFVEFKTTALMQADAAGRAKLHREAIGGSMGPGWMTVNEVRRMENQPPIKGGDERYNPTPTKPAAAAPAAP